MVSMKPTAAQQYVEMVDQANINDTHRFGLDIESKS